MADELTGQGQAATEEPGGQGAPAPAAEPASGAPAPQAGEPNTAQALQSQLDEQRKIQAGQDKRIAQLAAQVVALQGERDGLAEQLQNAETKTGATDAELAELRNQVQTTSAEKAAMEQQLAAVQADAERTKMVATEFPALAPLLAEGALPQANDLDELRAKLGRMNAAFGAMANAQMQAMVEGGKPPATPPANASPDLDALSADMMAALKNGDNDAYDRLREQWYTAWDAKEG